MKTGIAYTTASEIDFLDGLGLARLQGYLLAANRRVRWDGIDRQVVLEHCHKRIAVLEVKTKH